MELQEERYDEDELELDALLDDAADGIDGHDDDDVMKEDENKKIEEEDMSEETKQAGNNQEQTFDPLAGNGKKPRRRRRQRKGKDSTTTTTTTTTSGNDTAPGDTTERREEDTRGENDEVNGNGSACDPKIEPHAAPTKKAEEGEKKEEEEERRRSGASAAAAGSFNCGAHEGDNGNAGGDDVGVQNLVKRLRKIQTDARSAAGDSGGDAANMAEAGGDSEEALASMLEQLASAVGAEGGGSDSDGMQSLVDAMMGQLLSKEVLYKPMMEIRDKCVRHSRILLVLRRPQYKPRGETWRACRRESL